MEPISLRTAITRAEEVRLRDGQTFVLVELDVPYLRVLHFERSIGTNQVKSRKRRKKGMPENRRALTIWLHRPSCERVAVRGSLSLIHPLDGPAKLGLRLASVNDVPEGSIIEFMVR